MKCVIFEFCAQEGIFVMNILYINHYAGSIYHGMEFRPYYLAFEWVKTGHKVRIVGADFSHLRTVNPTVEKDFDIEDIEGIEYQWVKAGRYKGNGVDRALTMFRFVGKLLLNTRNLAEDFCPDIVISSSTYPLDAYAAKRIADYAGAKYVHEGHDLWPLTLIEIGGMSKWHPFCLLTKMAERFAYSKADHIVSVLPNSVEHMLSNGLKDRDKFTYIPNGIVYEDWQSIERMPNEHEQFFSKLKNDGYFIVCYLGGHAISNALDTFVDAAGLLKDENVAFVLVGKGAEKNRLINKAADLKNVYFLPSVSKKQVPGVLHAANVLYVGLADSPLYRYGVSLNKLYDYMMAGKPVIYGVKASNNEVEEARCGITIPAGDEKALANAVGHLMTLSSDELREMGNNGNRWVIEHCEYSRLAKQFLDTCNSK